MDKLDSYILRIYSQLFDDPHAWSQVRILFSHLLLYYVSHTLVDIVSRFKLFLCVYV